MHAMPPAIARRVVSTLQSNIGCYCNQACLHCHVDAGPTRKEMMDHETASRMIDFLDASDVATRARRLSHRGRRALLRLYGRAGLRVRRRARLIGTGMGSAQTPVRPGR